ncbi:hypothetical protein EV421DRAFT_630078 [Armillaria borealis]|uniref:Uncharacterized protein n=1 Tax=Armillaria borealis TaxID=47425 RepID=A0AA39MPM3_9AGAR|nr:hypothetical protein EV421DRAFT_630078 [Armillaria borealis]
MRMGRRLSSNISTTILKKFRAAQPHPIVFQYSNTKHSEPSFPVSDYFQVMVWFCVLSLHIFLGLGFFPQGMLLRSGVPSQLWYHDDVPAYCLSKWQYIFHVCRTILTFDASASCKAYSHPIQATHNVSHLPRLLALQVLHNRNGSECQKVELAFPKSRRFPCRCSVSTCRLLAPSPVLLTFSG